MSTTQTFGEVYENNFSKFDFWGNSALRCLMHMSAPDGDAWFKACLEQALRESSPRNINEVIWLDCYDEVSDWFANPKGKGLLLLGPCGLGKTLIARYIVSKLIKQYRKRVTFVPARQMNRVLKNDIPAYCIIDDLGTETKINEFGEKRWLFSDIVDNAEQNEKALFITSNLSATDIKERYGERTLSRLKGITKVIVFKGEDMRN